MNFAWGVEFFELSRGDRKEQIMTQGMYDKYGLHGNAILAKCLIANDTFIVRDSLPRSFFTTKHSSANANGFERRLGGRMALAVKIEWPLLQGGIFPVTLISSHKLEHKGRQKLKALVTTQNSIMGGDHHCPNWLKSASTVKQTTWPVLNTCRFAKKKQQGDFLCSNLRTRGFHVTMPCSDLIPWLSDHAIISVQVILTRMKH
mmetsp:Transcript_98915/g.159475  ORF Transcript_98915/g.159475 Transcript_98915/m.159475 type:complete len:203 (-) Transcript_98915:204-812(-)